VGARVRPRGETDPSQDPHFARLQWSMFLRVLVVTGLLIVVLVLRGFGDEPSGPLATLTPIIVAYYTVAALYAAVARRVPNLQTFTWLQFAVDALCISLVLLFTGGTQSVFTWLFVFNILGAGYLLLLRGGLVVATLDTVAYAVCFTLTRSGMVPSDRDPGYELPPGSPFAAADALGAWSTAAFHVVAFYLLAFLSGSLARKQEETGRALAETAVTLHRLQDMHGRIVQNMDAGLLTVDHLGRITSFNRAAEEMTRFSARDVLGLPVAEVLRGVESLLSAATDKSSSLLPAPSFERWMTRKDKKRVFLRVSASMMRTPEGDVDGHILVFEDRTRLLLMEEQLQREERLGAVGRLAAGIAHEIRNPLASITGSVQVLRSELNLPPEDDQLLGIVEREADRLGQLVTDFLSLTREEKLQLLPGRVRTLIVETLALLEGRDDARGIETRTGIDYDPVVRIDAARMRQVVWNLVNNAVQAMKGNGLLVLRTERVSAEDLGAAPGSELSLVGDWSRLAGGAVAPSGTDTGSGRMPAVASFPGAGRAGVGALRIVVEDRGPGIPDEALAHIFDPFYTTRSGGTGLGLAIVARIVQSHGGVITVQSRLGEGTAFSVWLPVDPVDQAATADAPLAPAAALPPAGEVAEDDEDAVSTLPPLGLDNSPRGGA
jgi:two-component system sensor histidine kinase PilS (NtrC family)